tara:strand:- start:1090 stop:1257 length:168 start_codon:yes stop_codon:yes gene_type:complete
MIYINKYLLVLHESFFLSRIKNLALGFSMYAMFVAFAARHIRNVYIYASDQGAMF